MEVVDTFEFREGGTPTNCLILASKCQSPYFC